MFYIKTIKNNKYYIKLMFALKTNKQFYISQLHIFFSVHQLSDRVI